MSHELSIINGIAEMAFLETEGECWHGLGQSVPVNSPIETWMEASNIANWNVEKAKALMMINGAIHRVPNTVHLVRNDNNAVLGTVTEQFNIHQPQDVVKWMFDAVDQLGFEMSTMGVLFDGKKFWAQANIKQSVNIGGVDRVDGKFHISVPNTGLEKSTFGYSTTRIVCNNTLRAATQSGSTVLRLSHMQEFKAADISDQLGLFDLADWQRAADNMARASITDDDVQDYFARVFDLYEDKDTEDPEEIEAKQVKALEHRAVKTCFELFKGAGQGAELVTAKGTVWGALNAVTEYADHKRNTRTWDARFNQSQFGRWADVKDRAWDEGLLLAA